MNKGGRPRSQEAEKLGRPLTSTERSRRRRTKLKEIREKNPKARAKAYKYHTDKPATPKERKQRWKEKQTSK
jgi:hypothetical protein